MKTIKTFLILGASLALASCTQTVPLPSPSVQSTQVPNGDFELWTYQLPDLWQTNSCPACVPPYETYIVQQDTNAYQGQFAAKFIYNNVYRATAVNGFSVPDHPAMLNAYVKSNMAAGDTVSIDVQVFLNNVQVDNGQWLGTASIINYMQIQVPISQNSGQADSVAISITGGGVNAYPSGNTELWVDTITLQ
jgi:hypothetical protein